MKPQFVVFAVVLVVVLAFAIAAVVLGFDSKGLAAAAAAVGGTPSFTGVLPGNLPVPGIRYKADPANSISAMYWTGIPEPSLDITADKLLTEDQMAAVFAGKAILKPQNLNNVLSWIEPSASFDTYAICPPGMVVTGLRVYTHDDTGDASYINVLCQSVLTVGSGNDIDATLGDVLDAANGNLMDISSEAFNDFYGNGMYLTAVNALSGTYDVNHGNALEDQSNIGLPPPNGYTTPNPVNPGGITLVSLVHGTQPDPWKPSSANHCVVNTGGAKEGLCDGGNVNVDISMTFLYYEYGDAPDAKLREYVANLWEMDWTAVDDWTYETADAPWTENVRFDPNRTINVTYANGGHAAIKGFAIADNGVRVPNGGVDNNVIAFEYFPDPTSNVGYHYRFSFGKNRKDNDPALNFEVLFSVPTTGPPANRMWVMPNDDSFAQAVSFKKAAEVARLVVTDPICTGVQMSFNDKGNPINIQNVGDGHGVNPFSQAACNQRAIDVCKGWDPNDPYCACINSKPIPGLSAIGINLPPRCMSNGACMGADPTQTWMDYAHADTATKCGKLAVDVCAFLWNMSGQTITLSNDTLQCKNTTGRCPECDVGTGPCKSIVPFQGHTACRTRQPDGTCGTGFVDCNPQPAGPTKQDNNSLRNEEIVGLVAGGIVFLILVFVPVWIASSKKRLDK